MCWRISCPRFPTWPKILNSFLPRAWTNVVASMTSCLSAAALSVAAYESLGWWFLESFGVGGSRCGSGWPFPGSCGAGESRLDSIGLSPFSP